jgi:hypothetical protein
VDLLKDEEDHYANPGDLKADPSPGWNKELAITYLYNGSRFMVYRGEDGSFSLGLLKSIAEQKRQPDTAPTP